MGKTSAAQVAAMAATHLQKPAPQGVAGFLPRRQGQVLDGAREMPLGLIVGNPEQARQVFDEAKMADLVASVAERGILQPLLVRPVEDHFMIVAGERRWRAVTQLHKDNPEDYRWQTIPVIVREYESDAEVAIDTAIENLQREDLTVADEAAMYDNLARLWDLNTERSDSELARRLGISHLKIWRARRIAKYPALAEAVSNRTMTKRQALDQAQIAEDIEKGRTPSPAVTAPDVEHIERGELDQDAAIFHGEKFGAGLQEDGLIFHGEKLDHTDAAAEPIVEPTGAQPARADFGVAPNQAITWRPLFLAQRNVSRLTERVRSFDLTQLPQTQRPTLIRTAEQAVEELQQLIAQLKAEEAE